MKSRVEVISLVVATIFLILGSGCASNVYVYPRLPEPVRPTLVSVSAEELACLSEETYTKLMIRQRELRQYAEELEVIIKQHNKGVEDDG